MINNKITIGFLGTILLTLSASAMANGDPDYDFSNADCNTLKIRQMLFEAYNELPSEDGDNITVIDVLEQKTIAAGKNKLVCYGTYEFSDGDKGNMTYTLYKNSLGSFINGFEPDPQ
ncbi:hypothetical protein [Citrobacter braakii]|uniref:hypothetical protein n=1 Tax=Citrobacter braakii TaxID=57706 RepID=UPI001FFEE191|nr:hypothetical protein [Citrobacter braakii]MCK2155704.1 hypothetical protein [Citrobacter braakii]